MVRTIEQILGLPPMNQMDLAARADDQPVQHAKPRQHAVQRRSPNQIPLDEMNPGSLPAGSPPPVAPALCSSAAPLGGDDHQCTSVNPYRATRPTTRRATPTAPANGCVEVDVTKRVGGEQQAGTFQPGWPANVTLRDGAREETLDWSELILSTKRTTRPYRGTAAASG